MLTSIGDAHVEVMRNEKGVCDVDASASLQRVGVGADVGTDTRPPALVTLGVGNRLRLELAAATNVERERVNEEEAADEQALVRAAAAWAAALRVGADDPPRSLSAVCGVAVAVQRGLFDGVSAEDAAVKVDKLLAALRDWTSVDATVRCPTRTVGAEGRGGGGVARRLRLRPGEAPASLGSTTPAGAPSSILRSISDGGNLRSAPTGASSTVSLRLPRLRAPAWRASAPR